MNNLNDFSVIYRNLPGNPLWEGSFYEKLAEYGLWDEREFWRLHHDLIRVAKDIKGQEISKELSAAIVKIYIRISSLMAAHSDPMDGFSIKNLNHEQIISYKERLDIAVIGVFSGEILNEISFDLQNPFLQ